jgi:hypothetical protein
MAIETDVEMLEIGEKDITPSAMGARVRVRLNKRPSSDWVAILEETLANLTNQGEGHQGRLGVTVEAGVIAFDVSAALAEAIHGRVKDLVRRTNAAAVASNKAADSQRLADELSRAATANEFQKIVGVLTGKK